MRSLLDFLAKYHHWLLFVVLEGLSFMLLFQFNHYQNSVWVTTSNTAVGRLHSWQQEALHFITLRQVNEELTRRNLILEQNNSVLSQQLAQLRHDSTATEKKQAERMAGLQLIPARVVTNSVSHSNNLITISAGETDGVAPGMGVVCGTGVVGIVYMTGPHFSIVLPLLNAKSRISGRLRDTQYFGYLSWDGQDPLYVLLDDVPRHARFKIGDLVETSGFSSVFPAGIFVGKVSAIENSDDGLSYRLRIHLGTDFSHLQEVSVISQQFEPEVRDLEHRADSLIRIEK